MYIRTLPFALGLRSKFREMHSVSRLLSDMCMSLSHNPSLLPSPYAQHMLTITLPGPYRRRSQLYKRGYVFRQGSLVIQMFQQEQVDPRTQNPIPASSQTLWEVEVKTASPVTSSRGSPLSQYVDQVLEVQVLMKGLLDLRRQDV